jgi:hypothetical protein
VTPFGSESILAESLPIWRTCSTRRKSSIVDSLSDSDAAYIDGSPQLNNLTATLWSENKTTKLADAERWTWNLVRTSAAIYNSGGGILRIGVEDDGKVTGGQDLADYLADHSPFAELLHDYLDVPPPFESREVGGYIEITIPRGVTSSAILRKPLDHPSNPKCRYDIGTVFIRKMNGAQPSSEPPKTRSDWLKVLHLWETNRGVTLQGQIIFQFTLLVNQWNPFDSGNTTVTRWMAKCLADVATPLGRAKRAAGLTAIVDEMKFFAAGPKSEATRDQEGSDYKQPIAAAIAKLCVDLDLSPPA